MKRRVIFGILAVAAISLALGGSAILATRGNGGQKQVGGIASQQGWPPGLALPTDFPTPDPYHLPQIPADWHMHFVGPHRCLLPISAVQVSTNEAARDGGRVFDNGGDRYYVTVNGHCVTIASPQNPQPDWISPALEDRADGTNQTISPCLISDSAVEVFTAAAAQAGGRVFQDSSSREYLTANGRCVNIAMLNPPDWLSPEHEAKLNDPTRNMENWSTPYPTEAVATFVAGRTATAVAHEEHGQ